MFNSLNFIKKIFKSSNQKELDNISLFVDKINKLEEKILKLKDNDFPKKNIRTKKKNRKWN